MPVPSVSILRSRGQPLVTPQTDFALCVVGYSLATAVATGALSTPYGDPTTIVGDCHIGDGVDAVTQALTVTGDNPAPPAVSFMSTLGSASLTAGVRGVTLTQTGTGASVVSKTASTHPVGTFEPKVLVVTGGTVGVAGIVLRPSLDGGRTWLPDRLLGTAVTFKIQLTIAGVDYDTGVQYDLTSDTLVAGDAWTETKTTPPQWAIAALYTAGSPSTGLLMTICANAQNFGLVAITEPVAAADIATLSAALTAMAAAKASCRPTLLVRFRDQAVSESDATYTAALATFRAACADEPRITAVAGDGWLTDAFRKFVYSRNGLPSVLARRAGASVIAGRKGEKVAQSPGWGQRGPLPDFTIRDAAGNSVGHDERMRPGALAPVSGKGGFLCFYYEGHEDIAGTYIAGAPCLYGIGSTVLTWMDNAISSGIERALYAVAFQFLQGADIVTDSLLDDADRDAMSAAAMRAIKDRYPNEFSNPQDPNLVTVDALVVVSGATFTVTWHVNDRLFLYLNTVIVTIANGRN